MEALIIEPLDDLEDLQNGWTDTSLPQPTERELQQELEREQRRINILDTASPKS